MKHVAILACIASLAIAGRGHAQVQGEPAPPDWQPLQLANFFQELVEPWSPVPNGPSAAPRQGWLNTDDGFFTREAHLVYDYTNSNSGYSNEALARFNYPLSQRFWVGLQVPFYEQTAISGGGSAQGIGDGTLTTEVMLTETRDLSVNAGVAWNLPWGDRRLGGGQFGAQPQISAWKDVGEDISLRGGVGYDFVDSRSLANATVVNVAIGQTVTPHTMTPFGDFTYYLSGNLRVPTHGADFFSLTPGMRTHLGGNLFFLAGLEVPVLNRNVSFSTRVFGQFVQGF
jgi:hypothetical protein